MKKDAKKVDQIMSNCHAHRDDASHVIQKTFTSKGKEHLSLKAEGRRPDFGIVDRVINDRVSES